MPFLTVQLSPQGPVVRAAILVSTARTAMLTAQGMPLPDPQTIDALIDTGASISGVDPAILNALGLSPTGEAEIVSPTTGGTAVRVPTYDVCIGIYAVRQGDLHFISETIQVTATELSHRTFRALIGTDVLNKCILHYNGADGFFTLAY
jgi:predicted aspartyl protease